MRLFATEIQCLWRLEIALANVKLLDQEKWCSVWSLCNFILGHWLITEAGQLSPTCTVGYCTVLETEKILTVEQSLRNQESYQIQFRFCLLQLQRFVISDHRKGIISKGSWPSLPLKDYSRKRGSCAMLHPGINHRTCRDTNWAGYWLSEKYLLWSKE